MTPGETLAKVTALLQADRLAEAAEACRDLIVRSPDNAQAHNLMGVICCRTADLAGGQACFARAVGLEPANPEYRRNRGFVLGQLGRLPEAEVELAEAIRQDPGSVVALHGLGALKQAQGRPGEALDLFNRAIGLQPGSPVLLTSRGNALAALGQLAAAADSYQGALTLAPESPEARFGLARVKGILGHRAEAIRLFRTIERSRPDYPGLQVNLGHQLENLGQLTEALGHYDKAIALNPEDAVAWNNRGNALYLQQRMEEAASNYRRALAIRPDYAAAQQNLLLVLNYTEPSQEVLYQESVQYERRHAAALRPTAARFASDREPARRIRVGYVSGDFRRHSVAYFIRGVLAAHDRGQVEVFCYANAGEAPDEMTDRIRASSDHWRAIYGKPDADVTRLIQADGIDILVDLNGHTAGNRLPVFARRPAPVQVTWLGYPNTTGLRTIDYRLTDAIADPPGPDDQLHSEELWRIPDGFLCFEAGELPGLAPPPAAGAVTFGSFNALAKLQPDVIGNWSAMLRETPGSRLVLKCLSLDDPDTRQRVLGQFARHGIDAERLELLPPIANRQQHLAAYARVDVALDPFPYNGTTTTFEALCMGVPVLTLRGSRHAGRVGASILHHAGLGEWIAENEADYVARARSMAADRRSLAAMRPAIRAAILDSPLTHASRFAAALEQAYRRMWTRWCAAGP